MIDGILTNFLPFMVGNLSIWTPMLTLTSLFLIYSFYYKNEKKYYMLAFTTGIIYDLLYTNLLFLDAIFFLFLAFITTKIYKNLKIGYGKLIIYMIGMISLYEILLALVIIIWNLVPISLPKLIYKITHSLLLNIIYAEILLLIINKIPQKYKKININ